MADLNIKSFIKKAAAGRNADEDQQDDLPVDDSFSKGVLKALGIEQEVAIPKDILTSSEVKGVQFRESTPKGYFYDDVDQWHSQVAETVAWFGDQLHARNLELHKIAQEIDRLSTDIQNHIYEKEALSANNSKLQAQLEKIEASGGLEANMKLQKDYEAALSEMAGLRDTIQSLEAHSENGPATEGGAPMGEDERAQYEAWAEEVQQHYDALLQENEQLRAALGAHSDDEGDQIDGGYEEVEEHVAEAEGEAHDGSQEEYVEYAEDAEEEGEPQEYEEGDYEGEASALPEYADDGSGSNRYAPELPPGTVLPSMETVGRRRPALNDDIRPDSPLRTIREDEDPSKYF